MAAQSRDAGRAAPFLIQILLGRAIEFSSRSPYTQCIVQVRMSFYPRLDVTVEEFAAEWRGSPDNLAIGEIAEGRLAPSAGTFSEPAPVSQIEQLRKEGKLLFHSDATADPATDKGRSAFLFFEGLSSLATTKELGKPSQRR